MHIPILVLNQGLHAWLIWSNGEATDTPVGRV